MQVVLNLFSRWGGAQTSSQKENKGPIAPESCLGFDSDHPLGSGGLDPLFRDNLVASPRPRLSQVGTKGPIAPESCLGFDSDHPLGSGGLDPPFPHDNEGLGRQRRNKRVRDQQAKLDCFVLKFKFIDDEGTSRVFYVGSAPHVYVNMPYQDIEELNIPLECLKLADKRYLLKGAKAQYTYVIGSKIYPSRKKGTQSYFTRIPVLHRSEVDNCLPFGIFNILQVPLFEKTKREFLDALKSSHCGLPELTVVAESFGIHLDFVSDPSSRSIDWLLSRESGLYLICKDVHCISVDVDRKLIFDCGFAFALNLHKQSLLHCGFSSFDRIRLICLPKYLMS